MALRLADGAQVWTRDVGGMTLSSPTAVNADLVVAAGFPAKTVMRLSGATGEIVWQSPPVMEQFSNTSPAVGAGLVVVGANGGRYYAFDAATGALRWDYVADGIVHLAAPLIAGGRVYMAGGGKSHRVHAVEAATGRRGDGLADRAAGAGTRHRGDAARAASARCRRSRRSRACSSCRRGSTTRWTPTPTARRPLSVARDRWWRIDPASGAVAWQRDLARAEVERPERRPEVLRLSDARGLTRATEARRWSPPPLRSRPRWSCSTARAAWSRAAWRTSAAPALASPVFANGRLITATMTGAIEGLASSVNHAPVGADRRRQRRARSTAPT